MRIVPLIIIACLSGCALVFQTPTGKRCFPFWAHPCYTLKDLDR